MLRLDHGGKLEGVSVSGVGELRGRLQGGPRRSLLVGRWMEAGRGGPSDASEQQKKREGSAAYGSTRERWGEWGSGLWRCVVLVLVLVLVDAGVKGGSEGEREKGR